MIFLIRNSFCGDGAEPRFCRSGFLDKSEVRNLACKLGVKFTDAMWDELDQDTEDDEGKDGKVTFPEFVVSTACKQFLEAVPARFDGSGAVTGVVQQPKSP